MISSYSKQLSTPGAESVRHCGSALAHACRQVFSVLKAADVLSEETLAQGAFGAVQVRIYEGDNKAFTAPHSDTVVGVDKEGNLLAEIDHVRACPGRHDLCPQPSKHRHAAAATCARSPPHTRVWPLSADREHGRGDLHDRRPDASVAEGGSTRPVPASRGFTLWCRSRTATSSFGRQALERTTGSSSTGFIGTAWSTSRGTRAGPPAGQRHIDCICVPLHAAEHRVFVPCV